MKQQQAAQHGQSFTRNIDMCQKNGQVQKFAMENGLSLKFL